MSKKLNLRFDPRTIEHLGIKMYSRLPAALAELIANGYDANATEVHIELFDNDPNNFKVIVRDNGDGMSFEEINDNFLVIGRRRRDFESNDKLKRKVTGRKGLGKLALFGIGKKIEIITSKKDTNSVTEFIMDWEQILSETSGEYNPNYVIREAFSYETHGTSIIVSQLKRKTDFEIEQIILSISKLFNFFDDSFKIFVSKNKGEKRLVTRDDRIKGIDEQYRWKIEEIIEEKHPNFIHKDEIKGIIISSKKPLRPDLRGITLYARGRQANEASFFGISEAGHTFSYITGWIEADYIDDNTEDFISTDRQQVDWETPLTSKLQKVLQDVLRYIVRDWSEKRSRDKIEKIDQRTTINVADWLSKVPKEIEGNLKKVIESIAKEEEIGEEVFDSVVKDINKLVPEYTYYHYRTLSSEVQDASKDKYQSGDFYGSFIEALKRYKNKVSEKSGSMNPNDHSLMGEVFGKEETKILKVASGFTRPNGFEFNKHTLDNVEEGQRALSQGIISGGRNVVSHEEMIDLNESGLFTEKDCLDFLSLLSHLFKRLEKAKKK